MKIRPVYNSTQNFKMGLSCPVATYAGLLAVLFVGASHANTICAVDATSSVAVRGNEALFELACYCCSVALCVVASVS